MFSPCRSLEIGSYLKELFLFVLKEQQMLFICQNTEL